MAAAPAAAGNGAGSGSGIGGDGNDNSASASSSGPPAPDLDPPFRGYIETTYDSLLVFEAARRGMIPRVTRRLIERERGMVQSGAVFVFDEHESGIKRWTDGLIWSPSRILGNFLVYRETDKKPPGSIGTPNNSSPPPNRLMGPPGSFAESSRMAALGVAPMAQGAMRPRSMSDAEFADRNKERQLVGSLTNSYKFKKGGLVKKTMSVTVSGYSQHMISYYTVDDVLSGKLRAPSTVPELAALDISVDYLSKQNFRFPPLVEVGPDGIPRYRGEGEEPASPSTPMSGMSLGLVKPEFDQYGYVYDTTPPGPTHTHPGSMSASGSGPTRIVSGPGSAQSPHPLSPLPISPMGPPGSATYAQQGYFDPGSSGAGAGVGPGGSTSGGLHRTSSIPAMRTGGGSISSSSSRRYDPYGQSAPNPRTSVLNGPVSSGAGGGGGGGGGSSRRMSIPQTNADYNNSQGYDPSGYDVKPVILPDGQAMYHPQHPPPLPPHQHQHPPPQPLGAASAPASAPSAYAEYYAQSAPPSAAPAPGSGMSSTFLPNPPPSAPLGPPPLGSASVSSPTMSMSGHPHRHGHASTLPPIAPFPPLPPLNSAGPPPLGSAPPSGTPHSVGPHQSPSYPSPSSGWPGSAPIPMPPSGHHGPPHSGSHGPRHGPGHAHGYSQSPRSGGGRPHMSLSSPSLGGPGSAGGREYGQAPMSAPLPPQGPGHPGPSSAPMPPMSPLNSTHDYRYGSGPGMPHTPASAPPQPPHLSYHSQHPSHGQGHGHGSHAHTHPPPPPHGQGHGPLHGALGLGGVSASPVPTWSPSQPHFQQHAPHGQGEAGSWRAPIA